MQRRDEDDLVVILELIVALALQFPVCVVDEYQDARSPIAQVSISPPAKSNRLQEKQRNSHCPVLDKQLLAFLEQVISQPVQEVRHVRRLLRELRVV